MMNANIRIRNILGKINVDVEYGLIVVIMFCCRSTKYPIFRLEN